MASSRSQVPDRRYPTSNPDAPLAGSNPLPTRPTNSRPSKRQKVSLACQECRNRKSKCDGVRPICGSCLSKKQPESACVYEPDRGRRSVKNQYVQHLESKVQELENVIRRYQIVNGVSSIDTNAPPSPPQSSYSATHTPRFIDSPAYDPVATAGQPPQASPEAVSHEVADGTRNTYTTESDLQQQNTEADENPGGLEVNAMGAITGNPEEREGLEGHENRFGYFGSSSPMRFMTEVQGFIGQKAAYSPEYRVPGYFFCRQSSNNGRPSSQNSRSPRHTSNPSTGSGTVGHRSYAGVFHDYVLPPRKVADSLVLSYWTWFHTLHPLLHKPSFMRTYSRLWGNLGEDLDQEGGDSEADPLFQCLLNLVFAIGCQLSPEISSSERELASDVFFQRSSQKLLHLDILEAGDIKVVQALLLMGHYLTYTEMLGRCWLVVGLAIRVAQGLGLHLEGENDRRKPTPSGSQQLEKEIRKRLWAGVISMAYGRPFMIPVTLNITLPQIVDDELLTTYPHPPAIQPDDKPSQTACAEVDGLLETLPELRRTEHMNSAMRLEMALSTWEKALPWFLQLRNYNKASSNNHPGRIGITTENVFFRQANVLRTRYLHICILLYRPMLVDFLALEESNHSSAQDVANTGLQKSLFLQSSTTCVSVAQELVEVIHRNITELLPPWVYNIFYLYTSATVLLMARLFPKIKCAIGEDRLIESWDKCLGCLGEYQSHSGWAKRCYEFVKDLDKLAFQTNHGETNPGTSGIQILGTFTNQTPNPVQVGVENGNRSPEIENGTSALGANYACVGGNAGELDPDLMDISWLFRLPVYIGPDPGTNAFNGWGNFV
ncbi:hypothetical protein BZG36_05466 [Bifiguratus adelaidae]|uniref:Zn(2)-C6 fungal-type domain-containing protein n=1 Tax=Bifiguratus adelaidae TaxID=1938954 RepID=A0A261XTF1_9FUNG|nr:hypothetical protein BZG36_05466 [Bifiguratus adelaidae]